MSMWYYSQSGKQRGPLGIDELLTIINTGKVLGDALVWEVGTKDWIALRDHPKLGPVVQMPPPLPQYEEVGGRSRRLLTNLIDTIPPLVTLLPWIAILLSFFVLPLLIGSTNERPANPAWEKVMFSGGVLVSIVLMVVLRPSADLMPPFFAWRRLLAKSIDISVAGVIASALLWMFWDSSSATLLIAITWFGSILLWLVMDSFVLQFRSNTIGRKLLGLRISPIEGRLKGPNYFSRSLHIAFSGLAVGIPLLATLMQAISYKRLRETGTTPWDRDRFTVNYERLRAGNVVIGIASLMFCVATSGAISNVIVTSNSNEIQNLAKGVAEEKSEIVEDGMKTTSWTNDVTKRTAQFPIKLLVSNSKIFSGMTHFSWQPEGKGHISLTNSETAENTFGPQKDVKQFKSDGWTVYANDSQLFQQADGKGKSATTLFFGRDSKTGWELTLHTSVADSEETKREVCLVSEKIAETLDFFQWNAIKDAHLVPYCL